MAFDGTGEVRIPGEEFWEYVTKFMPDLKGAEIAFGKPAWDAENADLVVEYAYSTECHPREWAKPPDFLKED